MAIPFSLIPHGVFCVCFVPERKDGQCFQKINFPCYKKVSLILDEALQAKISSLKWECILYTKRWSVKNAIQRWVGQLSMTNNSRVTDVFLQSVLLFSGQNKYSNLGRFWKSFVTIQESLASKKYKKYSFEYNSYNLYLTRAKSRTLSMFTRNIQI